ncbi:myocardin related transcription factor Ab isoform X2 [Mastacembelus armatus]|uniref:myocardin related transcription factor Ab isoform X2 n=1 Tax=Mastacembelus armatus TaxID=205130 RepID=UPI000E461E1C|nr:myocardin-related transcription factor A-like isoform X2 [Mastacembelus armatus]
MIMLDTNHCLSLEPSPLGSPPMGDDMEKAGLKMDHDRHVYHSLKEVLQLKLQQRRTREELVSQGIMPPLKSPAAFHEQRRSLERARTEDFLKRKIRSRPERSELVRMHILEETSAEPSLQAKQLQLKRARLADDLNDKISHRPGPIELVHKNILSVSCTLQHSLLDSPKGAGGESSSLDEDSSDALSPDQLTNHDSPLSAIPQLSPPEVLTQNGDISPTQLLVQPSPPPPPPPLQVNGSESSTLPKLTNGTKVPSGTSRSSNGQVKSQAKMSSERPPQRPKKPKDNKPKVKKLKYHQYIPPDQKADKERPPQMDSSYAKLLQQQQLFLQLQILSQQHQHYNYHTILPAPPKPPTEQPPTANSGPSPSRSVPTTSTPAPSSQSGAARQSQTAVGGAKPGTLPANLDEFKVAELKQELKLRGLTVSGTKNDLIERLRHYQEQNGGTPTVLKNGTAQSSQQGANSVASTITSSPTTTTTPEIQSAEGGLLALGSLAQVVPGRVMRFGSTSSSPPVSPTPSERSLAGMSPDETSCNGDMFGEMVSSPLTQLTLHPSPQQLSNISPLSQPLSTVKEEIQSSCSLSRSSPASGQPSEPLLGVLMDTSCMDKDQMLQEKDKKIEELTRMLRQKQRLVETLRSQLEQGKMAGGILVEKEGSEKSKTSPEVKLQTLIKASAIQPPTLPNGILVKVKKEVEPEEGMEGVTEEAQAKKQPQPMQCSHETLLRLQQIHRLQIQQAEQQKQQPKLQQGQVQLQKVAEALLSPQKQQKKEAQILLHQQQLQQLIIQQTQQKQLQAQQKLAQQKLAQQKLTQQNQLKQTQGHIQQSQQKNPVHLKQVQIQNQTVVGQKAAGNPAQQRKQLKAQQRQQQKQQTAAVTTQQVTPVIINQQNGTQIHTQAISLDLLKANGTPTLVTDSNGNHYLIALTSHSTDGQNRVSSLTKTNGRITLQRLQSSPSKLPSTNGPSKEQTEAEPTSQPMKKGQKAGLHLDTHGIPQPSLSVTAPPNLQPFFDDMSNGESQSNLISSLKREEVCPPYDRHTLFTPPSPKHNTSLPTQRSKENGLNSQQMDDLFDILLKSGEIPGFKANPDPSLAPLHSDPPSPSSLPSPLHLSPPTHTEPLVSTQPSMAEPCSGSGRLEDFLESTTGTPLLGMEPDGGLTLIDDLHSQMLSTSSILDHPPSPMDTSDLGFSPHSTGLDFGDPTLDSMDWLDISMVGSISGGSVGGGVGRGGGGGAGGGDGGTSLAPLAPHTPPSVFSADFLDSTDLQLHWESCL